MSCVGNLRIPYHNGLNGPLWLQDHCEASLQFNHILSGSRTHRRKNYNRNISA